MIRVTRRGFRSNQEVRDQQKPQINKININKININRININNDDGADLPDDEIASFRFNCVRLVVVLVVKVHLDIVHLPRRSKY